MSFGRSVRSVFLATSCIAGTLLVAGCIERSEPQQGAGLRQQAAEQKGRDTADAKAWREASADGTTEALSGYIRKFGAGAHVTEARARLLALEERARRDADQEARADASRTGTAAALRGYIRDFRSGDHVAQARARLAALEEQAQRAADDKAWAEASRVGTEEALTAYVRDFSSGAHVAQARERLIPAEERARRAADEQAGRRQRARRLRRRSRTMCRNSGGFPPCRSAATARRDRGAHARGGRGITPSPGRDAHDRYPQELWVGCQGGPAAQAGADGCVKSEHDARDLIARQWAAFTAAEKAQCINPGAYLPSYGEWLTCLEIERDVRILMQGPPANAICRDPPRNEHPRIAHCCRIIAIYHCGSGARRRHHFRTSPPAK